MTTAHRKYIPRTMAWLQIVIPTTPDKADQVSDALTETGALSVTFEDAGNEPRYQPATEIVGLWQETRVTGLYPENTDPAAILQQLQNILGTLEQVFARTLEDQDWTRIWMDRFQPMDFGHGLWICPTWTKPPEPDATNLILDPGMAFGTGTHATTALCLSWLAAHPPLDQTVLDYGCGSGILAIAALRLGAASAWATDVDPQALEVTRQNAVANEVSERLQVCLPTDLPELPADLVLANILAEPLMALAADISHRVKKGGTLILSGLLTDQIGEVSACYRDHFDFVPTLRDDWAMLCGIKQ